MVRAASRAPSVGQSAASKIRKRRKNPKGYKIQLELTKTKKKKLKLHDIHGSAKPRPGYTFLPVGYADLAERCKEQSRQLDVDVAVVSAGSRSDDAQKLTHHVHRIGYHFRNDIFDDACNFLGYREVNGKLVKETGMATDTRFERAVARYGPRFDQIDLTNHSEEEGVKVKKYIRELFPKIPETDLKEIYKRAWEEGARTVGNASNLSLSRQVQLATIARIRHTYTDYDKLLRLVTWKEARQIVEPLSLQKLIEWRGEQDNDAEDFEEILRETIVIDDDDDDSDIDSDDETSNTEDDSDTSLEIVQQIVAPKDLHVEVAEKAKASRKVVAPARQATNRVLPVAMKTRWRDARMKQRAADNSLSSGPPALAGQISVPLDRKGKAPRTFVDANGRQYIRISESPEPRPTHHLPPVTSGLRTPAAGPSGFSQVPPGHGHLAIPGLRVPTATPSPGIGHSYSAPPARDDDVHFLGQLQGRPVYPVTQPIGNSMPVVPALRGGQSEADPYMDSHSHGHRPEEYGEHLYQDPHSSRPRMPNDRVVPQRVTPLPQARRYQPYSTSAAQQKLEPVKPEDCPIPSREAPDPIQEQRSALPSCGRVERKENIHVSDPTLALHTRPTYQQPVFRRPAFKQQPVYHQPASGQPAYPPMRSQMVAMQVVPRPVHGAPAPVQPMSPRERAPSVGQPALEFGAPSPQKYFVDTRNQPVGPVVGFGAPSPQRYFLGTRDQPYHIPGR